jgi:sulfite exporter TauE/SafE
MEKALFLGIASGGFCLASCGPLAGAFLAAEGQTLKRSAGLMLLFLSGRLLGYLGWAIISWLLGQTVVGQGGGFPAFAAADVILGGWLFSYGFSRPVPSHCKDAPGESLVGNRNLPSVRNPFLWRVGLWGILSGFSLCPPFLAAVNEAAQTGSFAGSLIFFLVFYVGTGLWFIPFPVIGLVGRIPRAAQIARFCALPLGAYYIYRGLVTVLGGNLFYG